MTKPLTHKELEALKPDEWALVDRARRAISDDGTAAVWRREIWFLCRKLIEARKEIERGEAALHTADQIYCEVSDELASVTKELTALQKEHDKLVV